MLIFTDADKSNSNIFPYFIPKSVKWAEYPNNYLALILGKIRLKNTKVMKKLLAALLLIITSSFILTSCSRYTYKYAYRWGNDGLIYNSNNNELYTGTVLDTADVIIEFQVVDGRKNGTFKTFYPDGQVEKSGYVINNDNEGSWEYYYPTGQLESEGKFVNNLPEGKWISYYPNGNKKSEGFYKRGKQDEAWIYYNEQGGVINIVIYENGEFLELERRSA